MPDDPPRMWIFAGSNGSGKTTFATRFLGNFTEDIVFVNPDIIAADLAAQGVGKTEIAAGRRAIEATRDHLAARTDFAIETTLSGRRIVNLIRNAASSGWYLTLVFLWIGNPRLAKSRIRTRVKAGGHHIPAKLVDRRFKSGVNNFAEVLGIVQECSIFDNRGESPVLVVHIREQGHTTYDSERLQELSKKIPILNKY